MHTKKQRANIKQTFTQDKPTEVLSFSAAECLSLRDLPTERIVEMAVDNRRGFAYFMYGPSQTPMIRQLALSIVTKILPELHATTALLAFPPGLTPIIAAYADSEGECCWDIFLPCPEDDILQMLVDEETGQLVCFNLDDYFIKITPTRELQIIRCQMDLSIGSKWWTFVAGKCLAVGSPHGPTEDFRLWDIDWRPPFYLPRPLTDTLPSAPFEKNSSGCLVDDCFVYLLGKTKMRRISRSTGEVSILMTTNDSTPFHDDIKWCGNRHLLFAIQTMPHLSLILFSLDSHMPHTLATSIPDENGNCPAFCVVTALTRGPRILVYSNHDIRLFPVPLL